MKIESQDSDVESLLDSSFFYIPKFQRPYSWEDEHIQTFWDDVIANQSGDYFIGSMVVFKKAKQRFGVVDGQQRLTTITILLCVLRDKFLEAGSRDLAEGIHLLIERKDRSNKNEYVLKTESSFPYFQEHIQKFEEEAETEKAVLPEETNLRNAHARFRKLLDEVINAVESDPSIAPKRKLQTRLKRLTRIRDAILNLKVIFVSLENEDDAYIIFETLNTRGKDLALTDLVKNHFYKHMKSKGEVDHAKIKWQKMLETIHNSEADISTDNFIYHFWASRYEAVPLKKLFAKFRKTVTKTEAKNYLNQLVDDSTLYRSIYEPQYGWKRNEVEVARSLQAMQIFKLSQPVPAVLSLVRAYNEKLIKYARLRDALAAIENFHFQFTAVTSSRSSGGISAMYSSFAKRLYDSGNSQNAAIEIDALKKKLRERIPSLDEFRVAFKEIAFTNSNSKQKSLVRYILRKYAEHFKYGYSADFDDLTIEHLHPQSKIGAEWTEGIVGSLGNLLFVDSETNEKLSTKSFEDKKKTLVKAKYSVPAFVENRTKWTPKAVTDHTERMAELAHSRIWKI
jgi:uncharacterized protein with ParB-like and HNH nuclease domain